MLKIEKTVLPSPEQWEIIIEGMRNPMNSWDKMDSNYCGDAGSHQCGYMEQCTKMNICYWVGNNDLDLMKRLAKGGAVHAKYRRMIPVFLTINAPLYWWKEFDTYKVGTVANSCSTMHKIHAEPFAMDDFSNEHLEDMFLDNFRDTVVHLNQARNMYLIASKDKEPLVPAKDYWWQMIQLLPTSYNQKRTVMLNYEVLVNIYHSRKNHKLDEWRTFCDWIRQLPYSELITGGE